MRMTRRILAAFALAVALVGAPTVAQGQARATTTNAGTVTLREIISGSLLFAPTTQIRMPSGCTTIPYSFTGATTTGLVRGTGTPEGNCTAGVGTVYLRSDGGSGTSVYIKESGSGNTGWTAVGSSAGLTARQENTPTGAMNLINIGNGGLCTPGDHTVGYTFITASGETAVGTTGVFTCANVTATRFFAQLATDAPNNYTLGSGLVTSRRVCMSKAGTTTPLYSVAVTTDYDLTSLMAVNVEVAIADASLTVLCNTTNTTSDTGLTVDGYGVGTGSICTTSRVGRGGVTARTDGSLMLNTQCLASRSVEFWSISPDLVMVASGIDHGAYAQALIGVNAESFCTSTLTRDGCTGAAMTKLRGLIVPSDKWISFCPTATCTSVSVQDSGFRRSAAGVVQVTTGENSTYGSLDALGIKISGSLALSTTTPVRASGFGTNADASFATGSTPQAFDLNIGTGGAPTTGVITLPAAAHGWICQMHDATTIADNTYQSAYTTTSVTLVTTLAWSANDHIFGNCIGF